MWVLRQHPGRSAISPWARLVPVHKRMFFSGVRGRGGAGINSVWRAFAFEWQRNRLASEGRRAELVSSPWMRSIGLVGLCRFEAGEQHQVVGHYRRPDVGFEVVEPAPGATCETVAALEAGDAGLDPGTEVAQPAIDPAALDHVFDSDAALLVEGEIVHAA